MKPILTPEQAVELDRATQAGGVSAESLMERAGRAVARACVDLSGGVYGRRAVVVCGKGNNGGDGLVAARHLARWGMRVSVVALGYPSDGPAATNVSRLAEVDVRSIAFTVDALERELGRADVSVDAIFGTGFRGMPDGIWASAISALAASGAPVVAIDVPSGVDGTTGAVEGEAVRATLTVTFGAAKTGVVLLPGAERAGTVRVIDIGSPLDLVRADTFLVEPADVVASLPVRPLDAHKREAVLLVVAGSRQMTGAPKLIARAAARIGAGLVQVAAPTSALAAIQAGVTEATFLPLPETPDGTVSADALGALEGALDGAHAVAIGPGLGTDADTAGFVRSIVAESRVPLVVDADALNAFAGNASGLATRLSDAVLTPHVGEFSRMTGVKGRDLIRDRLRHARDLARTTQAITLLKGSRTVIAEPDGRARINVTGSPALATAGTGDTLTGMIGGLLACGVAAPDAASSAAYLHGLAGLLAGPGAVAGDLAAMIPAAVAHVEMSA